MFEVRRCECGKEIWCYSVTGKLVTEQGKIFVNDGHNINLLALINSIGIRDGDRLTIAVEKGEE